jgi:hypothetical protein
LSIRTESEELRAQVEHLRAERDRLVQVQQQIMVLLRTARSDKIVHDLRNVLNERDLLKGMLDRN